MKITLLAWLAFLWFVIPFPGPCQNSLENTLPNNNWVEWRGSNLNGLTNSESLPSKWSEELHIKWKVPIPGSGYSSPIIVDGNIYLTTSFLSNKVNLTNWIFALFLRVLNAIILFWLTLFVRKKIAEIQSLREWIILIVFLLSLLVVLLLGFFSENIFDYNRCDSRKWVGASVPLVLSLFSLSFFIPEKSRRLKKYIGFVLVLFPLFFFVFMPIEARQHLFRDGLYKPNSYFLYFVNLIYVSIGIFILLNGIPDKKESLSNPLQPEKRKLPVLLKILGSWFTAISIIILFITISALLIRSNQYLTYHFGEPATEPVLGWKLFLAIGSLWLLFTILSGLRPAIKTPTEKLLIQLKVLVLIFGISSFIFTNYTATQNAYSRAIVSVNAESGTINWICEGLHAPLGNLNQNSPATPTPTTDGKKIYAYFGTAGLFSCNLEGKVIWKNKNLPFKSYYGIGASPVVKNNKVIVFSDSPDHSYLTALNADTGKEEWRKELVISEYVSGSSRTPLLLNVQGIELIFIWNWNSVLVFDLESGEEVSSMVVRESVSDLVCGLISDSSNIYLADPHSCRAIHIADLISGKGSIIWEMKLKGPNVPSPILVNGLLYIHNERGDIFCIKPENGSLLWKEKLGGKVYFGSAIANEKNIYYTDNKGHTTIIEAAEDFNILAENKIDCDVHASPVPYGKKYILRSFTDLYCIEEPDE